MLKINWERKLIAMLLIFTLTFGNFALVGKTYAASILDVFSGSEGDTGSSNVEFDANFVVSEEVQVEGEEDETEIQTEELTEVTADVNDTNLSLKLNVKVSNSGYLKDAKIILGNGDELNFNVDSEEFENSSVQSFEDNNIELVQLNADSEVEITFPISYDQLSYVELDNISKSNVIKFEGTYVDDDEEISVSKEVTLNLSWTDERETSVNSEVTKYINYSVDGNSGVILQVVVNADNTTEENTLPVESSSIEIDVPTINDVKPETVKVVANSLMGTSGKATDQIVFTEDNWTYDDESSKLTISVTNESELVSLQDEDEVLIDETAEEVEAYYAVSGADEFLVTYIYNNVSLENLNLSSSILSTFNMYGGTNLVETEDTTYELTEEIGDIVTFSTETETDSVSKGYTYLNYNNTDNKYEIEIDNKLIFNISYKDIVSGLYYEDGTNYYVSNTSKTYEQSDIYYKSLKITQSNFNEILGESGYINIYDASGNLLSTINNETELNDNEAYEVSFDSSIKWIKIETSAPISEGNLIFSTVRAYTDTSFNKETYKAFEEIQLNSVAKAKYTYVDNYVDCGTATTSIALENTTTNVTLVIGQDNLSTLAMNNSVEMKIELNNDKITSDVYGESEFIVKMPDYIETVEITDYSIVYGEGLEISNVELYEQDGSIYLKINLTGTQTALSSGIVSNGTNIVLNANIKVNLYTPATTGKFELTYTNSEATSYYQEKDGAGYNETEITYSAPSGVVSVNSISGYNESNETISSVKQGTVTGDLDIYSNEYTATMELIIMNNEENSVSNISILGRTIFEENTDILTGESLGTSMDASMVSGIVSDSNNGTEFTIYYSTNGEATNDLNDSSNGWTTDVSDWSTIKSYLIVPNDSSYELDVASKLRFTYEFTIPENLSHNEDFYGTFATYYTNNTSVATLNEVSIADLVGLSTGVGPDIEVSSSLGASEVNEFEQFEFSVTVENTGEVTAENVVITIPVPTGDITYKKNTADISNYSCSTENNTVTYTIEEIEVGEKATITTTFYVDEISNVGDNDEVNVEMYAEVTCDDLGTTITTDVQTIAVNQASIKITIEDYLAYSGQLRTVGEEIELAIHIKNLTSEDIENATVTMYLDEAFTFEKGTIQETYSTKQTEIATFDESTRTITWELDSIDNVYSTQLKVYFTVNEFSSTALSAIIPISASVNASGVGTYTSSEYDIYLGKPSLKITQKTNTTNSYVQEGSSIEYVFTIENEGTVEATVNLTDEVPTGLIIKKISYTTGGTTIEKTLNETSSATTNVTVDAGESVEVTVRAYAKSLNGASELSVTNTGSITELSSNETITSNSITHIIEGSGTSSLTIGDKSTGIVSSSISSGNLSKTYNISGIAWIDENEDGARDDGETLMKGVTATLVDSDSAVIKQTAVTNSNGEYKFSGVSNGNYIIIFDYDTTLYTVTTYQKENIASNLNSDVISTKIEQDGSYRNGAVTDVITISDGSISNIDIGLIEAMKFDLSLDVGITKITVQNTKGTETKTYDNSTYTKTEISQRYLSGSEIYIEYTFTVTNEGEVAGYATSIVDYLPEGMNFNSSLNSDWYTGNDGNLYTTQIANTEIAPGETKTFTLVLSKTMTNENTGTVSNTAEIAGDYNIYGISDIDSTPGNNNQSEDDFARADSILSVGTGGVYIYISIIITTILLIGIMITTIRIRKKKNENKVYVDLEGGV